MEARRARRWDGWIGWDGMGCDKGWGWASSLLEGDEAELSHDSQQSRYNKVQPVGMRRDDTMN